MRCFPDNGTLSALQSDFGTKARTFIRALEAGGVTVRITGVYRPPQRSYMMYYSKLITDGGISASRVPTFSSIKNANNARNDEDVDIDWTHGGNNAAAIAGARAMRNGFGYGSNPVGAAYRSNHNKGLAVDMRFVPAWGVGKTVRNASGVSVTIRNKQDIINIGLTYGVKHWDSSPKRRRDDPHWSENGS